MTEVLISQQSFDLLLAEIQQSLSSLESSFSRLLDCLKEIDPFLNLEEESKLHLPAGQSLMNQAQETFKKFLLHLQHLTLAYNELCQDLSSNLGGRSQSNPLIQELGRQGDLLSQEIEKHQKQAAALAEILSILSRIAVVKKASASQKKKIESLVLQLQFF